MCPKVRVFEEKKKKNHTKTGSFVPFRQRWLLVLEGENAVN